MAASVCPKTVKVFEEDSVQADQVKKIIFLHQRFLTGQAGGRCANLQNADMSKLGLDGVDLRSMQASGVRFNDASLRMADLSKSDLFGAHFERADMRRANLLGADLRGAFFVETRLAGAIMESADLRPGAIYDAGQGTIDDSSIYKDGERVANLSNADMRDAKLAGSNMSNAVLYAANLTGADLTNVNLSNANMRNANLEGANVTGARLAGAIMTGANFRNVDLKKADLRGAYTMDANFGKPVAVADHGEKVESNSDAGRIIASHCAWIESSGREGEPADLSGLSLAGKDLRGMDFSGAKLVETVLHRANLEGAKFEFAMLTRANLSEAKLEGVSFDGADLSEAKFLKAKLKDAHFYPKELKTGDGQSTGRFLPSNLTRADFSGAYLSGADLQEAKLERTVLASANRAGARLPERFTRLAAQSRAANRQ
jgi:uncharacterized protein YjbI with pentapeptide repeats